MNQRTTFVLSAGLFLLALGGSVQSAQEKKSLETRVQELEFQTAVDAETVQALMLDVQALQAHRSAVEHYLHAQAAEAQRMAATLNTSEEEGFTSGINFRSRELLLEGWHAQLEVLRKDVPGEKLKKKPGAPGKGRQASR